MDDDEELADELALEGMAAGDAAAAEYLKARTRVMDAEYERLHLSHFREWMYTALEAIIGLILFLVFAAVASAVYEASRADGLVIESFSAPPDLVQKGLTGQVLASKLLDRLNAMQSATSSSRAASSFTHDWGNDIKVAIPDTGVSLGEVIRYLHNWLGHEMHLSGELYEQGDKVALTVRLEGEPGQTFSGRAADLDAIVQQAAEAVFRRAQTYRYSVYLEYHGRTREAVQVLKALSQTGSAHERAWADHGLTLFLGTAATTRRRGQRICVHRPKTRTFPIPCRGWAGSPVCRAMTRRRCSMRGGCPRCSAAKARRSCRRRRSAISAPFIMRRSRRPSAIIEMPLPSSTPTAWCRTPSAIPTC